jgi:hypothetical protein
MPGDAPKARMYHRYAEKCQRMIMPVQGSEARLTAILA